MKKWCLFLSLYFCICLLAACAGGDISASEGADSGGAPAEETQTGGETAEPGRVTETFRLVTAGDSDDPASVLAAVGGTSGDVYTLDIFSVEDVTLDGYTPEETAAMDWSPMPGALVEVTWDGSVMESYRPGLAMSRLSAFWKADSTTCAGCIWMCWRTCGTWMQG